MGKKKDLVSIVFQKKENYPLFYEGDDESHYLYFSGIKEVNSHKVLIYMDDYCMCDVRNLDMKLNAFVLNRGWI